MAGATIQAPSQPTARRFSSSTTTKLTCASIPRELIESEFFGHVRAGPGINACPADIFPLHRGMAAMLIAGRFNQPL